jgi:hypothetical protein
MECESAPLEVGAAVSAKFRGAFCEAVVKRVLQSQVEVKVKFAKEDKGVHVVPSKVRDLPRLLHLQVSVSLYPIYRACEGRVQRWIRRAKRSIRMTGSTTKA